MFSSLQPHRPTIQPPNPHPTHQQSRQFHPTQPLQPPNLQLQSLQRPPKSQIEAMPPSFSPPATHFTPPQSTIRPQWDPATCHPVFFTQSLRKPPFPFTDSGGGMVNPVAFGYVAEVFGGSRGGGGGGAKL
ncbi:hypothetical protein EJ08DRAFT_698811 [Tothia fuscella]|uniref:Uncharacterized protein n=1 Tax=Tothia fuscella TaxID=1048955 RepID=A0A9P4NPH4_9PEZI|nr:hypothetical protein EJ08DRAFT_698811 [Tothia fuscella]